MQNDKSAGTRRVVRAFLPVFVVALLVAGCNDDDNVSVPLQAAGGSGTAANGDADPATTPPGDETDGNTSEVAGFIDPFDVFFAPSPESDPFYDQPADALADAPLGTIYDSREVDLAPLLGIPVPPLEAWQIKYRSSDTNGRPVAAVATVVKPLGGGSLGSSPLLSYQFPEDGLGLKCAPSRSLTGGLDNFNVQAETLNWLPAALTQGWTIVFPDHEGPYAAYAAGPLAGQITLDGIRAALDFEPLGKTSETPIGMWGYSGGAIATAWAANLHPRYAPELNIVGVASGGTPADLELTARAFESGFSNAAFFDLGVSSVIGVTRAYPEALPENLLSDYGRDLFTALKDGCVGERAEGSEVEGGPAPGETRRFSDLTTIDAPLESDGAQDVFKRTRLPQPEQAPIADVYLYHALADELVPVDNANALYEGWCDNGATVRYNTILVSEHISAALVGAPGVMSYLNSRFSQSPLTVTPLGTQTCNTGAASSS